MMTKCRLVTLALFLFLAMSLVAGLIFMQVRPSTHAAGANSCGIAPNGSGYTFEWLHTAKGNIIASSGCIITLKGFDLPGLGFGAGMGGRGNPQLLGQEITWLAQNFQINFWRVFLNAVWWNEDVVVPYAGMHYHAWVGEVVRWIENSGGYVLLTKGPQFHEPPCGGSVTYCPPQDQAMLDIQKDPNNPVYQKQLTTGQYIEDAVTMWKSIASLYANDPAVIYDSWNEMHHITPQLWRQNTAILIDTIQTQNPRALVFFGGPNYENGFSDLIKGVVPAFAESNLVYDFHVYNGYHGMYQGSYCQEPLNQLWAKWPINANLQVSYAQQHGAVSFSEWGGCDDTEPYNTDIINFAGSHHIAVAYYSDATMVIPVGGSFKLSDNGRKVQVDYATL